MYFTSFFSSSISRGNVHTGATPPWLLSDDEEEEGEKERNDSVIILKNPAGPSQDDFEHWSTLSYNSNIN